MCWSDQHVGCLVLVLLCSNAAAACWLAESLAQIQSGPEATGNWFTAPIVACKSCGLCNTIIEVLVLLLTELACCELRQRL
jgi:hypothetical protein